MEINLEKHVGFQKLPQEEVELIQTQKTEKSRFKICIIITLCLAFIGILAVVFYIDQKEILIEYRINPMNKSIVIESDMQVSYEKYVYEEKSLEEQIEEKRQLLDDLNKTVCSNSSHPDYDLCGVIQSNILDYQDTETDS